MFAVVEGQVVAPPAHLGQGQPHAFLGRQGLARRISHHHGLPALEERLQAGHPHHGLGHVLARLAEMHHAPVAQVDAVVGVEQAEAPDLDVISPGQNPASFGKPLRAAGSVPPLGRPAAEFKFLARNISHKGAEHNLHLEFVTRGGAGMAGPGPAWSW